MVVTAEWLAGFFDGEGSIDISCTNKCYLAVRMCVVNTHLPTLMRIHQTFGGSLHARNRNGSKGFKESHMPCYCLSWHGHKICKAISEFIAPYVLVKKDQIDFLLDEWFPYVEKNYRRTAKGNPYGQEVRNFKKQMVSRLKEIRMTRYETNLLQ